MRRYLDALGIEVEFGPVYSVFENKTDGAMFTYYRGTASDVPTGAPAKLVPIDEVASLHYTSSALADMMQRFATEYRQGVFRVYVGDDTRGDIHQLDEGGS